MTKRKLFALSIGFGFLLQATTLFAEEICYQNTFNQLFRFSGGKLAKKPYVVEFFSGPCGFVPGMATSMKDSSGNIILAIHVAKSDTCAAVVWYLVGDPRLDAASGTFDNLPRNFPPHSPDTITRINCMDFPSIGTTINPVGLPSNAPGMENEQ